jgi:hypothetical protein
MIMNNSPTPIQKNANADWLTCARKWLEKVSKINTSFEDIENQKQ